MFATFFFMKTFMIFGPIGISEELLRIHSHHLSDKGGRTILLLVHVVILIICKFTTSL